jgi:adenylate kinase
VIAVMFGPPGSGKGTQASRVAERLGIPHIATGDMLRDEVARATALGREAEPIMRAGNLVPDDLVVRVIESRLAQPDAAEGVLLDGFPRTVHQAQALDEMLPRSGKRVDVLVALRVPEDVLRQRVLRRAEIEGRSDDTPEAFTQRMATYRAETEPVLEHYEGSGTRIVEVDGVGSIEDVTERIVSALSGSRNPVQAQ